MAEDPVESLIKDTASVINDFASAETTHKKYLKSLETLTADGAASSKALKHVSYVSSQIKKDIHALNKSGTALTDEQKQKLQHAKAELDKVNEKLKTLQYDLPAENSGALNVTLLDANSRYRYKKDYESFKMTVTYVVLVMLFLCYMFPSRAIDALANFLLVWYYCTLTIRESILRVNRSRIKGWWVTHHYISCVIAGITLTWNDGECYKESRNLLIGLTAYVSLLQLLQHRYQTGCLRRLHSLGQRDDMDITVEGFSSWMFKGLTFLIPFLLVGYFVQAYCGYCLYAMYFSKKSCGEEWQVIVLSMLFFLVAAGNLITILAVVIRKVTTDSKLNITDLTAKYHPKKE
uniref:Transmembrane protein n=1 Tax=Panagrellus redivivus TaxID=6233 RepID=A0A7E4V2F2_PANRE